MLVFAHIRTIILLSALVLSGVPDNVLRASNRYENVIDVQPVVDQSKFSEDSLQLYKERAINAAVNNDLSGAAFYVEEYVKYSAETGFVESRYFKKFAQTKAFEELRNKYAFHFDWLHFFYLFSSLTGFFIGVVLLLKKGQDALAKILISVFVLMHSFFIFHIFLFNTNLNYKVPHVLYTSASFSYLYGPLIYFYFKRITLGYQFKKRDLLHLLPTLMVLMVYLPIYLLPESEKVKIMFEVGNFNRIPYLYGVVGTKTISLAVYGFMLIRLYYKNKEHKNYSLDAQRWLNALVVLVGAYVISYLIYGLTISELIPRSDFLYNLQIVAMASMVLYIGYSSYIIPSLFVGSFGMKPEKYTKSGLTPDYSIELKEQLLVLLKQDKIYLRSDVSLDGLAEKLNTNRHNASQVINEHFGLNFFELMNKYRIQDAVEILEKDKKVNIIDVAYQVGFNNKVTFNKSFKKFLSQTPSQFIGSLRS
jgi:AraC-like DNA-binding protein